MMRETNNQAYGNTGDQTEHGQPVLNNYTYPWTQEQQPTTFNQQVPHSSNQDHNYGHQTIQPIHNQYGNLSWNQPTTTILVNREQINQEPIRIELNILNKKTLIDAETQTHRNTDILREEFVKNPTMNEVKIRDMIDTFGMSREEIRRFYAHERKERNILVRSRGKPSNKETTGPQTAISLTYIGETTEEIGRRRSKRAQRIGANDNWILQE